MPDNSYLDILIDAFDPDVIGKPEDCDDIIDEFDEIYEESLFGQYSDIPGDDIDLANPAYGEYEQPKNKKEEEMTHIEWLLISQEFGTIIESESEENQEVLKICREVCKARYMLTCKRHLKKLFTKLQEKQLLSDIDNEDNYKLNMKIQEFIEQIKSYESQYEFHMKRARSMIFRLKIDGDKNDKEFANNSEE
jgi:hypothetical protein